MLMYRTGGAVILLPLYAFVTCTGTTLSVPFTADSSDWQCVITGTPYIAAIAVPPECTAVICLLGVPMVCLSSNHKHLFFATTTGPDNKHLLHNKFVQKISYLLARHLCCWLERWDQIPGHLPEPWKIAHWPDGSNSHGRSSSARRFPH